MTTLYWLALLGVSFFLFNWLWRYTIKPHFTKNELRDWLAAHPQSHEYKITLQLLELIYKNLDAYKISYDDRKKLQLDEDCYIYGEINFLSFLVILELVTPKPGEVFYDLGCGAGKPVFAAAFFYHFSQVKGLERLPALAETAKNQIGHAKDIIASNPKRFQFLLNKLSIIEIIQVDILNADFSDGDVIFINATCFHYDTWEKIKEKLLHLKVGARIIINTKRIFHDDFKLIYQGKHLMSWGVNSVNIYQKMK